MSHEQAISECHTLIETKTQKRYALFALSHLCDILITRYRTGLPITDTMWHALEKATAAVKPSEEQSL